jgi:hypothetical protein
MTEAEHVTFVAAFPGRGQVIKYDADGGARIILDIPASDEDAIEQLRRYRGYPLMVTIVPMARESLMDFDDEAQEKAEGSPAVVDCRRAANRRNQRAGGAV